MTYTIRTHSGTAQRGFTLLEVLISVSLAALVSVIALTGVRQGTKVWNAITQRNAAVDEMVFVNAFFRRTLENAYPRYAGDDGGQYGIAFSGNDKSISVISRQPLSSGSQGFVGFSFSVSTEDDISDLTVTLSAGSSSASDAYSETLIDSASRIEFSYFDTEQLAWRDSWTNEQRLPKLIRLQVDKQGAAWPDLVIETKVDVDVRCKHDRLTKYCVGRRS